MSKKAQVQVIEKDGKPEYAVVPYDQYERLRDAAEDAADLRAFEEAKAAYEPGRDDIPIEITKRIIAGENPVRVWRRHRGLTQPALARIAGISQTYLSQIENGVRDGTVKTMRALAAALDVDLDTLT